MLLVVDHYDSFTDNLVRYFKILGQPCEVVQHDRIDPDKVNPVDYFGLVLSPGPGRPEEAKTAQLLVQRLAGHLPILGVCLGCQVIATAFGARVIRAPRPAHGYLSAVEHDGQGVFAGLPNPLTVTRYHSLVVDPASVPDCLAITAWTAGTAAGTAGTDDEPLIMGLRHRHLPIEGIQFHPEAYLTEGGLALLANFIEICRQEQAKRPCGGCCHESGD
jgi:para-aminobenzoate synthetase component 2